MLRRPALPAPGIGAREIVPSEQTNLILAHPIPFSGLIANPKVYQTSGSMRSRTTESAQALALGGGHGFKQLVDKLVLHLIRAGLIRID
jgi:hypothetical protein